MKGFRRWAPLLLATCLTVSAWGDVFVKNRPFKGSVSGKGEAVMVEAEPMLKALGAQNFKIEAAQIVIDGKTVPSESGMVSLKALTSALGAKMIVNSSMGTIDVYQAEASAATDDAAAPSKPAAAGTWGAGTWHTSWEAASQAARSSNKPILINFTGSDWCGWCKRLKAEVFDTEEFRAWAGQRVVLLEVDFPKRKPQSPQEKAANQALAKKFKVSGYPSIYFANAKGDPQGTRFGYYEGGPAAWTRAAEQCMKKR